jgi:hypothetical protein
MRISPLLLQLVAITLRQILPAGLDIELSSQAS